MNKRQSGFTLVEIAIVLVIIGLLLGGVLKGQEMIANSRFKNMQSDIEAYRAAFYTFQDRFGALPGDYAQANIRLNPAATNGIAPVGTISGATCATAGEESCLVWQHLRYANLIPGDPQEPVATVNPTHAYGGQVLGMFTARLPNNATGRTGVWLSMEDIPADAAARYDREMDDGNGATGLVVTSNTAAYPAAPSTAAIDLRINIM
jgi:prepilin-type N-terminal cleavage/methylation domain-containing protein